jgi:copper homeostasis protein
MPAFQLEICCYNYSSCVLAQDAGAQRIELCANPAEGGTTPNLGLIKSVKEKINIPVFPIIRPRGGDFLFSAEEYSMMQTDVLLCKQIGFEGIVIGILNPDGSIDRKRCASLVEMAYPMEVTFHRAFDRAANPSQAMEDIIDIGCTRILTSGQRPAAMEGIPLLTQLIQQADDRIVIMPGAGVRASNILAIAEKTKATEFHSSAGTRLSSGMQFINHSMKESLENAMVNKEEVGCMLSQLKGFFNENS